MATVSSSSTRSKRKSNKPVTTDKGRANRSSVSQAKVSKSGGGTSGSAKVTTGKGGTGAKLLPPGQKGGALVRSSGGKLAAKAGGGALAKVAGGAGRFLGAAGTALAIPAAIKNIANVAEQNKRWEEYKERNGMNQKPNSTNRTGQGTTAGRASKPAAEAKPHARRGQGSGAGRTASAAKPEAKPAANWRSKVTYNDPKTLSKQQDKTTNKPQPSATPKPSGGGSNRPAATSGSTGSKPSTQGSSSTAKPSSSRNVGPVANGEEYARNKDPKKYNPLMQKTFNYQKGDAPDQRAKRANYAGTDTGVSPKNTGSKNYADKKPDNKTTAAYDSGVNLNPAKAASPAKPASPNDPKKKKETLAEAMRRQRTGR
jgi:hypothetical protein